MRPSEIAQMDFESAGADGMEAYKFANGGASDKDSYEVRMAQAVTSTAYGLNALATGLRATYILLEEINRKLDCLSCGSTARAP
jgi:hypothetical protein